MNTIAPWAWVVATLVICAVVVADQLLIRRLNGSESRRAVLSSAVWVVIAVLFGAAITVGRGGSSGVQFYSGYLLELALSVDNVFVFVLLFRTFSVPQQLQARVLTYGIVGAIALRGGFIAAGGALVEHVSWIFYVFGAFLVLSGLRMARESGQPGVGEGRLVRVIERVIPYTAHFHGDRFVVRIELRRLATPLFMALVAIDVTDVVFATDSIPAIFGVTRDLFLVATSNALAVLGLRSFYFVLAEGVARFRYLGRALAVLLVFIGVKMLLVQIVHVATWVNLVGIFAVLGAAVIASAVANRRAAAPLNREELR